MPFGSSRTPRPFATNVRATVKWYNPTKGFGFVSPDDGSPDVFLHVSVVEQAGLQSLDEGSILVCDLADGQKGAQVSAIHSVEAGSAPAQRSSRSGSGSRYPRQSVSDYDDYGYGSKPAAADGRRHRQVVQPGQGLRLHRPRSGWERRIRPHPGRRACWIEHAAGEPAGSFHREGGAKGSGSGRHRGGLTDTRPFGIAGKPVVVVRWRPRLLRNVSSASRR